MKQRRQVVSPITLQDHYVQQGEYSVKMVIDPRESPSIETVEVDVRNSDGRTMEFSAKRWGTKLTVQFKIDEGTPDGVAVIDVTLSGKSGTRTRERFDFWVIK